jgi:hypothetical protein
MKNWNSLILVCLLIFTLHGCGATRTQTEDEMSTVVPKTVQVRVVDVSNDTKEIFDVDAIGMLWTALNESLKKQGMLWTGNTATPALHLEAHITEYRKGNILLRYTLPMWGKTVLAAKCTIKEGSRIVATTETRKSISITNEGMTFSAYKKIFSQVADELIRDLARKI